METTTVAEPASFLDALLAPLNAVLYYLPSLLAAVLIVIVGWLIARALRSVVRRVTLASNRLLDRAFPHGRLSATQISSAGATLFGEIVFWAVVLVAVSIASRVAGFNAVSGWLDRIAVHLPNLVAGVTILGVGYFLSVYVREQIAPQEDEDSAPRQRGLARAAQAAVVAVALIVGLDQVGIDVALLVALAAVAVAALLAGLAFAFAFGARRHVSNLIGVQSARRTLSVGMRVQIDDIEGEILELTATQIALETDAGKTYLPARLVDEVAVTVLSSDVPTDPDDG